MNIKITDGQKGRQMNRKANRQIKGNKNRCLDTQTDWQTERYTESRVGGGRQTDIQIEMQTESYERTQKQLHIHRIQDANLVFQQALNPGSATAVKQRDIKILLSPSPQQPLLSTLPRQVKVALYLIVSLCAGKCTGNITCDDLNGALRRTSFWGHDRLFIVFYVHR